MSNHDYVIDNAVGATVRADMNSALAAIVSNNSSATEPATMYAYQFWADTTTGLLKLRNAANSAWITIGTLASTNLGLALLNGSASQTFSAAAATAAAHAMRWDTPNMASLTVTQATGALTFAGIAHPLTFRSATLTNGAVSTIIADPADLVLPSGGTLGFTTTVQGRIIVAEMNNGGVSEYAICNQAGGLQMDETNLISTTAIGTGSDAANVWYSTTARTNLPYKIVGAVDVVNTADAWGDPVLVQAAGGNALTAMNSMGYGQTRIDQTASRAVGTTYYNTGNKPRTIVIGYTTGGSVGSGLIGKIDGVNRYFGSGGNGDIGSVYALVQPGESYSFVDASTPIVSIQMWMEMT